MSGGLQKDRHGCCEPGRLHILGHLRYAHADCQPCCGRRRSPLSVCRVTLLPVECVWWLQSQRRARDHFTRSHTKGLEICVEFDNLADTLFDHKRDVFAAGGVHLYTYEAAPATGSLRCKCCHIVCFHKRATFERKRRTLCPFKQHLDPDELRERASGETQMSRGCPALGSKDESRIPLQTIALL